MGYLKEEEVKEVKKVIEREKGGQVQVWSTRSRLPPHAIIIQLKQGKSRIYICTVTVTFSGKIGLNRSSS